MEPFECKTMTWNSDDVAHMLKQLNELGAQGWEVIGRLPPGIHEAQLLILKRHKAA